MAAMLLLVKCYGRKKVESLVELTIIHVVWSRGGELTKKIIVVRLGGCFNNLQYMLVFA